VLIETNSKPDTPDPPAARRGSRHRWHAVTILAPASACAAAQACKGKRLLSTEAPLLPLKGCDAASCACRYRHYDDRRGPPRREDKVTAAKALEQGNRRRSRGRRESD
jgi:hypothetical protein